MLSFGGKRGGTFDTGGFWGAMGSPQRGLAPTNFCGSRNASQVDAVRLQPPEQVFVGGSRELQGLDGALRAETKGEAESHQLPSPVLGRDGQPGDEDIRGASAGQAELRSPQRD